MMNCLSNIGKDKLLHFAVSACIAFILSLFFPSHISFGITLAIGAAKEGYDKGSGKGSAEWQDLLADALGAIVGAF